MLESFLSLPKTRLLFWALVMVLMTAFILFSIINGQYQQLEPVTKLSVAVAALAASLLMLLIGRMSGLSLGKRYVIQSIVFTMVMILLCGLALLALGIDPHFVIDNYFLAFLFPINMGLFHVLRIP